MTPNASPSKAPFKAQSAARLGAVQALYQMEATGAGVESVIDEFTQYRLGGRLEKDEHENAPQALFIADQGLFQAIMRGVVDQQASIDGFLARALAENWRLERINATARAVLRAAFFELTAHSQTPFRIVIDEYLDVAHAFLEAQDVAFINGVLDAAARYARPDEAQQVS